jgi:hypothetical protein
MEDTSTEPSEDDAGLCTRYGFWVDSATHVIDKWERPS